MSRNKLLMVALGLAATAAVWIGFLKNNVATIGDAEIADESRTEDWLAYGRTHSEQRYSPLDDIDRETLKDLGVAWFMNLPNDVGLVSTPPVFDQHSLYATQIRGGRLLRFPVGVKGAPLLR